MISSPPRSLSLNISAATASLAHWGQHAYPRSHARPHHHCWLGGLASHFFSIQALFSDHVALGVQYSLPSGPSLPQTRLRITILPKYCSNYVSCISSLQSTYDLQSPDNLYFSLVDSTHKFYTLYVTRPHVRRHLEAHVLNLGQRILLEDRKAVKDSRTFQQQPTPARLHQYQVSRDVLVELSSVPILSLGRSVLTALIMRPVSAPCGAG